MPRNLRFPPKHKPRKLVSSDTLKRQIPMLSIKRVKSINEDMGLRTHQEFYNSKEWKSLSASARLSNPHCMQCGKATPRLVVDHIIELKDDYTKRLDITNLIVICYSCHKVKTDQTRKQRITIG